MKTQKAVYAASLDPITNGHINVAERMAPLYDEFVVVVAVDTRKTYTFSPEERVAMAKAALTHLPNVTVDVCIGRYVVKYADSIGAHVIVRGLRNFKDLEDEQTLAAENRRICSHIETVWVPCLPDLAHVSSSMVKGHVGIDPSWEEQVARSVPVAVVAKLKDKFVLGKARKHWAALMSQLRNPKGNEEVFDDLVRRYGEPHRAYHTLSHIVMMLDELAECTKIGANITALVLAAWFHDAIYDTHSKGNEDQSATLAKEVIRRLGLPDSLGEQVSDLVLATKHTILPVDETAKLLIDLDLSILGQQENVFDVYEVGIRKEYEWIPEENFRAGRSAILQSFLERQSIYSTAFFRDKYESTAQTNLVRSIGKLQK